jgi:hypothetical protein
MALSSRPDLPHRADGQPHKCDGEEEWDQEGTSVIVPDRGNE